MANVSKRAGKPEVAEQWYRKAIDVARNLGDEPSLSIGLANLADLLRHQTARLPEARELAEAALAIHKTLDPAAAEIWKTYGLLVDIAEREGADTTDSRRQAELQAEARKHRRLARDHQRDFAGTRHALQRHLPLIVATVLAIKEPEHSKVLEEQLGGHEHLGWANLVAAIHSLVAGA